VTSIGVGPNFSAPEECRRRRAVATLGREDVDDLAVLIDRPVQVGPPSGDLDVGLIDEPPVTASMAGGSCCVDELRRERLHPPLDRHVVHDEAALGEQFFDIAVGQAVTQLPAHRDRNHLAREAVARGRRRQPGLRVDHRVILPGAGRTPSTQQGRLT
jgi:hypothetical protein